MLNLMLSIITFKYWIIRKLLYVRHNLSMTRIRLKYFLDLVRIRSIHKAKMAMLSTYIPYLKYKYGVFTIIAILAIGSIITLWVLPVFLAVGGWAYGCEYIDANIHKWNS